jgi:hypothetical protein
MTPYEFLEGYRNHIDREHYPNAETRAERRRLADWLQAQPNADDPAVFEPLLHQIAQGHVRVSATPSAHELVLELIDLWGRRDGDWTTI